MNHIASQETHIRLSDVSQKMYIYISKNRARLNDFKQIVLFKNVWFFYYSLFDSIFFLFYIRYFNFFLSGTHTGTHASTLRTGSYAPAGTHAIVKGVLKFY